MRDYKNIKVFQKADQLVLEIYKKTARFPKEEQYSLTPQIRRAAISVPTNIVEGASRKHSKEYLNFLFIARGSLKETTYVIDLSMRLGYLDKEQHGIVNNLCEEVSKMLYGLIKHIETDFNKRKD